MSVQLLPIHTHLIMPGEDLAAALRRYAAPRLVPGDVLVVSSKVVAISQGRLVRPEHVRPGPGCLAKVVSRFIDQNGSLSSPYALQAAINEDGRLRYAAAFLVGGLTRVLLGRRGDFYRIAGYTARVIDDVSGTLPPFDKHIVLPPRDPEGTARRLGRALGWPVAIVDANDLGNADVLGATPGIDRRRLREALRSNPAGNAAQQTPFLIVRGLHVSRAS